jgi:translocation and assembly module TamB
VSRGRTVVVYGGIGLLTLAALGLLLGLWLLGSSGGSRFLLERARAALPEGALEVGSMQGSLTRGLELRDVVYRADGLEVQVDRLQLRLRSLPLIGAEIHVADLEAEGARVRLPPGEPAPQPQDFRLTLPESLPALDLPLALRVDSARLRRLRVEDAQGEALFEADEVQLAASLVDAELVIDRLDVDGPMGSLQAQGRFDSARDWLGELSADGQWQAPRAAATARPAGAEAESAQAGESSGDEGAARGEAEHGARLAAAPATVPLPFTLQVKGPLSQLAAQLRLPQTPAARLDLDLTGELPEPEFAVELELPAEREPALAALLPAELGALALRGQGDPGRIGLSGSFDFNGQSHRLDTLQLRADGPRLLIESLDLSQPAAAEGEPGGAANAQARLQGELRREVDAIELAVEGEFTAFELPFGPRPWLSLDGAAKAQGALAAPAFELDLKLARGELAGAVRGRAQLEDGGARMDGLVVDSGQGQLIADGRVAWSPRLEWTIEAGLREFDPALLAPDWPGALSAQLRSEGHVIDVEPGFAGTLQLSDIDGSLRGAALRGSAQLTLDESGQGRGSADLDWGESRLRGELEVAQSLDGTLQLEPLQLALLDPSARGQVRGRIDVSGSVEAPQLRFDLSSGPLGWGAYALRRLQANGRLGSAGRAAAQLQLEAADVQLGSTDLGALRAQLEGTADAHALALELGAGERALSLDLEGGWDAEATRWQGRLQSLQLREPPHRRRPGGLALQAPATLDLGADRLRIEPACLRVLAPTPPRESEASASTEIAGSDAVAAPEESAPRFADNGGRLCLEGDWDAGSGGRLGLRIESLPLGLPGGLLTELLAPGLPWRWRGVLQGEAELEGGADDWRLTARLESPAGSIGLPDPEPRTYAEWRELRLEVDGSPQRLQAQLGSGIGAAGELSARLSLVPALAEDAALEGELRLELPELDPLELALGSTLVDAEGRLSAQFSASGTRAAPQLQGGLRLEDFSAELPALGIRPEQGQLSVDLSEGSRADIRFQAVSGGRFEGSGWLSLDPDAEQRLQMEVSGSEVLVSDTLQLNLTASPEIELALREQGLRLRGRVEVPRARIDLDRLEGSVQPSPDVVVLDPAEERDAGTPLPVDADLRLALGDDVRLEGFGLEGKLGGELRIRERPGRAAIGSGSLNVSGRYEAYGQKLEITRGRLSFAQSPLDNPALDIRAERKLERVTAGIRVTGNAIDPQLTLWSDPALDQADVLSYLVLGRPLRAARSGEGQQLNAAATALGAGGNLLAERLGARLGFDQAGVEESATLGGAALMVGKYLSPRLYVAYGVALFGQGQVFSIKYILSELWDVEIEASDRETRGSLNYRLER